MERQATLKYASGAAGNYDVYLALEEGKELTITLHSMLNQSVCTTVFTDDKMPPSCKNLFESIDDLFSHMAHLLQEGNKQLLGVSDIGEVVIGEMMERKGKQVRVQCNFHCERVPDEHLARYYLRIIRHLKQEKKRPVNEGKVTTVGEVKSQAVRLFLTVDMINNPFITFFNKFQEEVQIQGYNKTRLKLFFNQTIPKGLSYITLRVINLKINAFALGIIDQDQDRSLHKSPYSFAFEYYTGEMKDTGKEKTRAEARWRKAGGLGTQNLKNALIRMEVNTGLQSLRFFCNGHIVGETTISNYLMGKRLTPYISCKHQGDRFQLNPNN